MNRIRKYSLDESFFDTIDTESKAYWLGFISADGYVSKSGIALILKGSDSSHLVSFLSAIGSSSPVRFGTSTANGRRYLHARAIVHSARMVESLSVLGVTGNKSLTIVPCPVIPPDLKRHYWRGVFDGDGCIMPMKGQRGYMMSLVGNEAMLDGFAAFADLHTHLRPSVLRFSHARAFRISYGGVWGVQQLAHALYDNASISLPRKKDMIDALFSITPLVIRTEIHTRQSRAVQRSA